MKWDKENKKRLYAILLHKFKKIKEESPLPDGISVLDKQISLATLQDRFLEEFGIEKASRLISLRDKVNGGYRPVKSWYNKDTQELAAAKGVVIIPDPWYGKTENSYEQVVSFPGAGLIIPKEVAEKFLVLGVP